MAVHEHKTEHCEDYLKQLSDYIDGTLSPELCKKLEAHMAGCENCTVVVNTLKRTIELYQDEAGEAELSPAAKKRLYSRLSLDEFLK
jgi:anti-sigma factor RsiW